MTDRPARIVRRRFRSALAAGCCVLGVAGSLACAQPHEASRAVATEDETRPSVFRSTLDGRPRIVTLRLAESLYAAYDVEQGALFKLWRDGVELDGAVYTGTHGPQPSTKGNAWIRASYTDPWRVTLDGRVVPPRLRYRGHALDGETGTLRYELVLQDGARLG